MEDDFVSMIMSDASPSDISDAIKGMLFAKSVEKIDELTPYVAASMFGTSPLETEDAE
ncbi:hypothetical protein [Synechococcus phage DSL-LC02]|nr:hypothetical protein [Synechococcus phage DSL-LC02]